MVQVLMLNNERFLVPELAFSPSDIGLKQGGIAQQVTSNGLGPCKLLYMAGLVSLSANLQDTGSAHSQKADRV